MNRSRLIAVVAALTLVPLIGCGLMTVNPATTPTPTPIHQPHIRPSDEMTMVRVPGGDFVMGSTDAEVNHALRLCEEAYGDCQRAWFENEQPAHDVTLDPFRIDQTEVTNAQFAAFLNAQREEAEGNLTWANVMVDLDSEHCLIEETADHFRPKAGHGDHPAVMISWYGAKAYCAHVGARLPTEAEWEYASRNPDRLVYPWGDAFDGALLNACDVNCPFDGWKDAGYDDGYAKTAPVGSYPRGPAGAAHWTWPAMPGSGWPTDTRPTTTPVRRDATPTARQRASSVSSVAGPGRPHSATPARPAATGTPRPGRTTPWASGVLRPWAASWLEVEPVISRRAVLPSMTRCRADAGSAWAYAQVDNRSTR